MNDADVRGRWDVLAILKCSHRHRFVKLFDIRGGWELNINDYQWVGMTGGGLVSQRTSLAWMNPASLNNLSHRNPGKFMKNSVNGRLVKDWKFLCVQLMARPVHGFRPAGGCCAVSKLLPGRLSMCLVSIPTFPSPLSCKPGIFKPVVNGAWCGCTIPRLTSIGSQGT